MDVTGKLAEWSANWQGDASEAALHWARAAVYDTVACMVAGAGDEGTARLRTVIGPWGSGPASVVGATAPAAAPWAALVNGMATHVLDYDDNVHYAMTHPSAVILPALLALAEEIDASGRQVLEAWLVGLEVQVAVGLGVNRLHYDNGWHATSTVGTIGAAAACGRLLGLDVGAMRNAISFGVSMASGVKAQFGTMAKPFHAGMAAKNAVIAAQLAAGGMDASPEPIDGHYGFRSLYAGGASRGWEGLLGSIGKPLAVEKYGLEPKCYPCCAGSHRAVDGLFDLRTKHGFTADDVAEIVTLVGWGNASSLLYPRPTQEMEARFSMEYTIAAALLEGCLALSDFTPEAIRRPQVQRLLPLIKMETHDRGDAEGPAERKPARVTVRLKNGTVHETSVQHARGTMYRPFTAAELDEKFRDCVEGFVPAAAYTALQESLRTFDSLDTVRPLMQHLRFSAGGDRGERFTRRPHAPAAVAS
jgi:2-methylcitrate dehydratase PrpD